MRLDYSILWIEDSSEFIDSIRDDIEEHIRECGFVPKIKIFNSIDDKDLSTLNGKEYDLMLIDYHLASVGADVIDNGQTVIRKIRDRNYIQIYYFIRQITIK